MEKKHGVLSIRDDGIPLLIWRSTRRSFWHSENKIPPTIRFYGWNPPTLSVGYFQNIEKEINLDAVKNTVWAL